MSAKKKKKKKKATSAKKKTAPAAPKKKSTTAAKRLDFGDAVETFFAKQTGEMKALLDALRAMVEEALPTAEASLKWACRSIR